MTEDNLCVLLYGSRDLRIERRAVPRPGPNELQIRMLVVGLCGSDVGVWRSATNPGSDTPISDPLVLGHEPCGVVSELGPGVTGFAVGDRVAMNPNLSCGTCQRCLSGQQNICERGVAMMMAPPTHGCLCNFMVWPAHLCFRIAPSLSAVEGALVQPLACALNACQRAKVLPGHRVLVCGAGPLGMMVVKAAGSFGASRICVTEIKEERLQLLTRHSACAVVGVQEDFTADSVQRVLDALDGHADVSIECSGSSSAVRLAIHVTRPGGCILLAGLGDAEVKIPLLLAAIKEIDIRGMMRFPPGRFPQAIELITAGVIDVKPLVTHVFSLEKAADAFKMASRQEGGKIVIECSKDRP